MGEKLDRDLQRALLQRLFTSYPDTVHLDDLQPLATMQECIVNVAYLAEHGLAATGRYAGQIQCARITARGLDFLADDGGLTAILGVMTVKLHEDTLKDLVASRISASDLDATEKSKFLDQLRELPGEATKHLILKLIDTGLENWHRALPLLRTLLGG